MADLFYERRPSTPRPTRDSLAFVLALIAASSMLYFHLGLFLPHAREVRHAQGLGDGYAFGNDFYPIWLTSRQGLREHRDPYSVEMTRQIQTGLFGRPLDAQNPTDQPADYRSFAYPAFIDLLFWPMAGAEFPKLRIFLAGLLPLLTACSVWWWTRALDWRPGAIWLAITVLLTLCNYPVLEALFAEQPGLIVGFFLAGSILALRRNRFLSAGILMALTTIKPQMTLLVILYLLLWSAADWRQRAGFACGFLGTILVLVGASLMIWPHWIGAWMNVLFEYHRYSTPPLVTELLGPMPGIRASLVLIAALLGTAILLAWRKRRASVGSLHFWLAISLLLAITSVTLLPGQAVYDHIILLPGILLLLQRWPDFFPRRRVGFALQGLGAIALFWPSVAAFGLILTRSWLAPGHLYSAGILALPIRTAASFPFVVLALLALAARNASESG